MGTKGNRTPVGIEATHGVRLFSAPLGTINAELFIIDSDVAVSRANGDDTRDAIRMLEAELCANLAAVTLYVNGKPHSTVGAFIG